MVRDTSREGHTLPTFGWVTKRETVTVAVLFMKPTLVTRPVKAMGGMVAMRVAGAGLLASCGDVTVSIPDYFNGGRSNTLSINKVSDVRTDWQLTQDVKDQNGGTIKSGSYVICDNKATNIEADVSWTGNLAKLGLQLKGVKTGNYINASAYPYTGAAGSGSAKATFAIDKNMAPLSINAQAIIVNPTPVSNVNVKGYTYLRVQGQDTSGRVSDVLESNNSLPVVDCL